METKIDNLRKLIRETAQRNLEENTEYEIIMESARRQARRDISEWVRIIEQEIKLGLPFVTLYEKPLRQFGLLDRLCGKARDTEPNVDRTFLRNKNEMIARITGDAYAKELGTLLGRPFVVIFSEGGFSSGDPGLDNGGNFDAKIHVSWDIYA
jgi:hypothetical protein